MDSAVISRREGSVPVVPHLVCILVTGPGSPLIKTVRTTDRGRMDGRLFLLHDLVPIPQFALHLLIIVGVVLAEGCPRDGRRRFHRS
jgi:hypothetical protein